MEQDIKILEEFCGALAEKYLDQIVCDESELYQAIKNIIKAYKELEEENKNYKIINETLNNILLRHSFYELEINVCDTV